MAAELSAGSFDAEQPQAFYLPNSSADWEALSDATLVVQGARLPVHSQVLSVQSGVLRGLFADFLGSTGGLVGCKRKADSQEEGEGLVLEEPFRGSSLFEAALFLRLAYQPHDTAASLAAVRGSLLGLLRLAHKLDAPHIVQAVNRHLTGSIGGATIDELLAWVAAGSDCQQAGLHAHCIRQLARHLASHGNSPASTPAGCIADCMQLAERCDSATLAQVLGLVVAAGGSYKLSSPYTAEQALADAARHGSVEWVLERFSQQPAGIGESVCSPYFTAAVFLESEHAVKAKFRISVVDQAAEAASNTTRYESDGRHFEGADNPNWGWRKFMTLAELRSKPGYLAGDRLVLRAHVEVVP